MDATFFTCQMDNLGSGQHDVRVLAVVCGSWTQTDQLRSISHLCKLLRDLNVHSSSMQRPTAH